ncbi:unnamed protein product, partial [Acidithrix sp. C25]
VGSPIAIPASLKAITRRPTNGGAPIDTASGWVERSVE